MPPVIFALVSPQFFFKSGQALLFRLTTGPRATLTTTAGESYDATDLGLGNIQLEEVTIRDGETLPVAVNTTGLFQAVLAKLTLIRSSDGRQFEVGAALGKAEATVHDIGSGRAALRIDGRQILTIRVQDAEGLPATNVTVSMCVSTREGSSEQLTNEQGEVVCLGVSGQYHVSAQSSANESCRTDFQISDDDSGERVVILTLR